jgi:hypothetical protein
MQNNDADVAELVDARDLKSLDGNVVWVRVPPPAPAFAREAREGCCAEAFKAKAGCVAASYGLASHTPLRATRGTATQRPQRV